jgi:hypothetical protein
MDCVTDNLFDGRKIRALTIVGNFSRQCLAIQVGQSLKGEDVVVVMQRLHQQLGLVPKRIQVNNGSEFISKALDRWPTTSTSRWTSRGPVNQPIIRISNRLTAASVMSA